MAEGGGQLSIVLVGHPKLRNDLRRPKMEEVGDRTTVFEFGGLRDRQRDYIDWVMKASLQDGAEQADVLTDAAATLLAAKLKTPLQIGRHLVRAFEAAYELGAKPVDIDMIEAVLSRQLERSRAPAHPGTATTCAAWSTSSTPSPARFGACSEGNSMPLGPSSFWTRCAPPGCRPDPSHAFCASPDDLASVSPIMRPVSRNVRRSPSPVSTNVRRKQPLIARRPHFDCAPL